MAFALRFLSVAVLGFVLMFVAHVAAFLGYGFGLPYWWGYVILYPIAAIACVRGGVLRPMPAALGVCLAPALYFLALGVAEGDWHASNTALLGVCIAFVLCLAAGMRAARRLAGSANETT